MTTHSAKQTAQRHAGRANSHPAVKMMARGGFIVIGILHILIGWIAVQIATGSGGDEASNSGALSTIAEAPGGRILLWVAVAALAALALWRFTQVFVGEEAKDKVKGGVLAVIFASLAFTTATFARGSSTSDKATATDVTARVLEQPWGAALVIIAGLVVLGVGLYSVYHGATKGFKDDLEASAGEGSVGSTIIGAGMAGHIARGIAFGILGILIVVAGWRSDPEQAAGLDAALRALGQQPFGMVLLVIIGVGLALYGLYSIARARYVRM